MCIGSNSVNQAQDLVSVTKFEDFPNSLLPTLYVYTFTFTYGYLTISLLCRHYISLVLNRHDKKED